MSSFVSKEKRNLLPLHIDSSCMITTRLFKALFLRKPCWSWGQSNCQASHLLLVSEPWSQVLAHLIGWRIGCMGTETHLSLYVMFSCSHRGTVEGLKYSCPICGGNMLTFEGTEERCQKICRHKIYICVGKLAICSSPIMWFPWWGISNTEKDFSSSQGRVLGSQGTQPKMQLYDVSVRGRGAY